MERFSAHRLAVSFWSCVAFTGLGVSLVVFAPTLLDIAHRLDVGVGLLSVVFLVRAAGGVIGTMGSGMLMDRFPQQQYTLLCCVLVGRILATAAIPLSLHVVMLGVVMFLMGLTFGGLNNSVHAILMRLWGEKSGPCLQFLHASFAVGAFLAPLIARPFITDISDSQEDYNTSLVTNISCSEGNIQTLSCENPNSLNCICFNAISDACTNKTSSEVVQIFPNCSTVVRVDAIESPLKFGWAYWISAMFLVLPFFVFIYFALKHRNREKQNDAKDMKMSDQNVTCDATDDGRSPVFAPRTYKYPALLLLFCFMFCYIGLEVSYGSLLFTFAVKSQLQFDKQSAATLTALFWGLFAFARLFSVLLALLRVRASVMMALNVLGSAMTVPILIFFPHNHAAIWIASALLGASFASIYPTTMTWLSQHIPVSGKSTGVVVAGGNLGDILLPSAIAALMGNVSPDSFVYSTVVLIALSTALVVTLFSVTAVHQRRHTADLDKCVQYCRLDKLEMGTDGCSSDQDNNESLH